MRKKASFARGEFKKINSGHGKLLGPIDKRIIILEEIREDAIKTLQAEKETFQPGYDRQAGMVHLFAMTRDLKKLKAARDELAEVLGSSRDAVKTYLVEVEKSWVPTIQAKPTRRVCKLKAALADVLGSALAWWKRGGPPPPEGS